MSVTALGIFVNRIPPAGSGCVCTPLLTLVRQLLVSRTLS